MIYYPKKIRASDLSSTKSGGSISPFEKGGGGDIACRLPAGGFINFYQNPLQSLRSWTKFLNLSIFGDLKFSAFILAVYLLVLFGIPCSAEDGCCPDELVQMTSKHQKDAGQDPANPCSPFFACGSCHGVVLPDLQVEFVHYAGPRFSRTHFYLGQRLRKFSAVVWQPPKVC